MEDKNEKLRELQKEWYKKPNEDYHTSKFSSPFCFGLSEQVINGQDAKKPLLMYVGEEARNFCFSTSEIEYIQNWTIAYFEKQIYNEVSNERIEKITNEKDQDFLNKRRNSSPFWNFLRRIKNECDLAVCWNNLDKLHGVESDQTVKLNESQEKDLHTKFEDGHSLLWHEIKRVQPNFILFMGAGYAASIEWALSLEIGTLNKCTPGFEDNNVVVTLDWKPDFCKKIFGYQPDGIFWINHPNALCHHKGGSKYGAAIEILKKEIYEKKAKRKNHIQ